MFTDADYASLLTSLAFRDTLASAGKLAKSSQAETAFHCWSDGEHIVINTPAEGESHRIKGHHQDPEQGVMYPEDTGLYEGVGSQVIAAAHVHPTTGCAPFYPRIHGVMPSFEDLSYLFEKRKENVVIAEEFDHPVVINPVGVITDLGGALFFYQFPANSIESVNFLDLLAKAVNTIFVRCYRKGPRRPWMGVDFWVEEKAYGHMAPPPFLMRSQRRFLEFLNELSVAFCFCPDGKYPDHQFFSSLQFLA